MREELIRTWQLKTVYIIQLLLCTCITRNNLHRTSKLLNFHPALYSLTQKAVILNTCCIVRKYLTEQLIKNTWPIRNELFFEPT